MVCCSASTMLFRASILAVSCFIGSFWLFFAPSPLVTARFTVDLSATCWFCSGRQAQPSQSLIFITCDFHYVSEDCVTQCQPEDTHGEFQPSNRNELLPKSPPFHAKGRRSTDPITNARCKGTDGSGNGSGRLHGYIPRGYFNPSLSPSTKQYSVPFRTDKGKPFS